MHCKRAKEEREKGAEEMSDGVLLSVMRRRAGKGLFAFVSDDWLSEVRMPRRMSENLEGAENVRTRGPVGETRSSLEEKALSTFLRGLLPLSAPRLRDGRGSGSSGHAFRPRSDARAISSKTVS